jgi:uncharacterized protein YjeT (DUF2065 family)
MSSNKIAGIILIVVGAVLLYFGLQATGSFAGEMQEAVTGRYSNETMFYLIGGGVALVVGIVMVTRRGRR